MVLFTSFTIIPAQSFIVSFPIPLLQNYDASLLISSSQLKIDTNKFLAILKELSLEFSQYGVESVVLRLDFRGRVCMDEWTMSGSSV
jgi:hypothetical protein